MEMSGKSGGWENFFPKQRQGRGYKVSQNVYLGEIHKPKTKFYV